MTKLVVTIAARKKSPGCLPGRTGIFTGKKRDRVTWYSLPRSALTSTAYAEPVEKRAGSQEKGYRTREKDSAKCPTWMAPTREDHRSKCMNNWARLASKSINVLLLEEMSMQEIADKPGSPTPTPRRPRNTVIELLLIQIQFLFTLVFLGLRGVGCWRTQVYRLSPASTFLRSSNTLILYGKSRPIVPYLGEIFSPFGAIHVGHFCRILRLVR